MVKVAITQSINIKENRQYLNKNYVDMLIKNGITPIILPVTSDFEVIDQIIDMCDGIVLSGGDDVNPKRYGAQRSDKVTEVCDIRDELELHIIDKANKEDIPLLAICRGMQILNVYFGGTLYQDLPSEVNLNHSTQKPYDKYDHEIEIVSGGIFEKITNEVRLNVNTIHHQAVKELGYNLKVEAKSLDGIIEAISVNDKKFMFGVQYHPDFLFEFDKVSNDIIKYFKSKLTN